MTRDQVPAYLYEETCDELLLDPVQLSADITALIAEIRQDLLHLAEPVEVAITQELPPPPVRKEAAS